MQKGTYYSLPWTETVSVAIMSATSKKIIRSSLRSQTRQVIYKVISFYEKESMNGVLRIPLTKPDKRAAAATGVSLSTLEDIKREFREVPENSEDSGETPSTSGKRSKKEHRITYMDNIDKCVVRDVINEYYLERKKVPYVSKLLPILRERVDFPWKRETFKKTLHQMGYRYMPVAQNSEGKKSILVEKADLVAWRTDFLERMKKYRQDQREIIYVGEMGIDKNVTFQKFLKKRASAHSENRLIIVHAGTSHGFVPNVELIYEPGASTGDYHGDMDYLNFEKWLQEKLLPNIQPHSVIFLDNSPHHSKKADPVPSKFSTRKTMTTWLDYKGIACDSNMRKPELFELIQQHAPKSVVYRADKMLIEAGHDVVRPPPHHGNLSVIQFVWSSVERFIKEKTVSKELDIPVMRLLLGEAFQEVGPKLWREYCAHVEKLEEKYWEVDGRVEDIVDEITTQMMTSNAFDDTSSEDNFSDASSNDSGN